MVDLIVNGQPARVEAEGDMPLIYALRNSLGLMSVKLGCGLEQCGSCTVLVDGAPAFACTATLGDVAGRAVRTVEGLAGDAAPHPVQAAVLAHNAAQCGYCLSGILMRAVALFEAEAHPSRQAIAEALDGNLCRCGAQPRLLTALAELSRRA